MFTTTYVSNSYRHFFEKDLVTVQLPCEDSLLHEMKILQMISICSSTNLFLRVVQNFSVLSHLLFSATLQAEQRNFEQKEVQVDS